jgi:hypothetical protein
METCVQRTLPSLTTIKCDALKMKITRERIASVLIITCMAQVLSGCVDLSTSMAESISTQDSIDSQNLVYAYAQETIDYGQSQLLDLSRKATELSLNMTQAANAAAQSTQDYNQRQQIELDYQATVISQDITQAAATQEFIMQQTKMAVDATAESDNRAAAATHSAFLVNATQTAQSQAFLEAQVVQNAQAEAASTVYPLTATPLAKTQAALLIQQYDREQQSFVDKVVSPLIPIFAVLVIVVLILGIALAYWWFMPRQLPRRMFSARRNSISAPVTLIDGVISDYDLRLHQDYSPREEIPPDLTPVSPLGLPGEKMAHVEIVSATEPPVAHWVAEVEQQLAAEERLEL